MMSGTSLDGIDVAAIETDGKQVFQCLPGKLYPYTSEMRAQLKNLLGSKSPTPESQDIEHNLTELHASAYKDYVRTIFKPIDVVGFHGHTITHCPPSRYKTPLTWQLGDGRLLARKIGVPVVYDLRKNDVQHGGEGAPLVPIYQKALVKDLKKPVAIINIGGISNVAYIDENALLAFDMGPGNALLDQWMEQQVGMPYDAKGAHAAKGVVDREAIQKFQKHPYFKQAVPKSLDRLDYTLEAVQHLSLNDGAATLVEMTAMAIKEGTKHFPHPVVEYVVTGGGRHNTTLMNRLTETLAPIPVVQAESLKWNGDFLEAEAWAYLAVRSVLKLPITFPTTTGVEYPLSGGIVANPIA